MIAARTPYLTDIPLDEALALIRAAFNAGGVRNDTTEIVDVDDALDRVSAVPVVARLSSPHYHACAMDGIAIAAVDSHGASESSPVVLHLGAQAHLVDTGDPLPVGTDAVIMIEEVEHRGDSVAIRMAVAPFTHVRPLGEDVVATEAVVSSRRLLGPAELAAIASAGVSRVEVVRRPRVGIVTTGDELVDIASHSPPRGAIVDSNAVLLAACMRRFGAEPVRYPRVGDDPSAIGQAIDRARDECDVVLVNAGSSAGRDDYTARVFAQRGTPIVHGVAIRPGHPIVVALADEHAGRRVPLFGIPGYPVSAALCAEIFVQPLIRALAHLPPQDEVVIDVRLARKLYSPIGEHEYVRAVAGRVDGELVATPLRRGAGAITSLARANCIIEVPRFVEGAHAGTTIRARALQSLAQIERTLLIVGSHDVALDLLAGALAKADVHVACANVGSIAGIVAVAERSAHLAGTHVLDPALGTYNDSALARFGAGMQFALIRLATRTQGLIVARGNPHYLRSLRDIAQPGIRFINRQRDAGTRILLDSILEREQIDPRSIAGYERIEFSHLAVAALVRDGSADVGLGVLAAARALDCDFVPLAVEPYELAVPFAALEDEKIRATIAVLQDPSFRSSINALGGYDAIDAGSVRFP